MTQKTLMDLPAEPPIQHIAILKKSWGLLAKILAGEKTIESRWYKFKCAPWDRIKTGETIYFKDSGAPVTIKAEVGRILQFEDLNAEKIKEIRRQYGKGIGIDTNPEVIPDFVKDKKYCILIWLKNPREIESFNINKAGFGISAAWLCAEDIEKIKIKA